VTNANNIEHGDIGVRSTDLSDLVDANHILFNQAVVDAFGHVSMRDSIRRDRFWLSASKAPALVQRDDLISFDFNGNPESDGRPAYLERFIHAAIYRARPDVMAIVHSHSKTVIPFGISGVSLRPVCHMCGFIKMGTPVFEIREHAGTATDLLIRDLRLGTSFADCLGSHNLALMRGHGITVVGSDLRQAVFRAIYVEVNARLQIESLRLSSDVVYLTDEEADAADAAADKQINRAWDLWKQQSATRF